jgi:hypothetical protein
MMWRMIHHLVYIMGYIRSELLTVENSIDSNGKMNLSLVELYTIIKRLFPTMSHAPDYKTLTLLKKTNQVFEIYLRNDSQCDGNCSEPHPHLICPDCKEERFESLFLETSDNVFTVTLFKNSHNERSKCYGR